MRAGSGKTVLARAAAADAGAALLIVNGPDVVSEFFGELSAGAAAGAAYAPPHCPDETSELFVALLLP